MRKFGELVSGSTPWGWTQLCQPISQRQRHRSLAIVARGFLVQRPQPEGSNFLYGLFTAVYKSGEASTLAIADGIRHAFSGWNGLSDCAVDDG